MARHGGDVPRAGEDAEEAVLLEAGECAEDAGGRRARCAKTVRSVRQPGEWLVSPAKLRLGCATVALCAAAAAMSRRAAGRTRATPPDVVASMMQQLDGRETECSDPGQDCRETRCCKSGGQTCYAKGGFWASCLDTCTPGMTLQGDQDALPWNCTTLGPRAHIDPHCAWPGQSCEGVGTCCMRGFQCIRKAPGAASCVQTETWDGRKLPAPPGVVVGGWRRQSPAALDRVGGQPAAGTSLFCFMAVLPGSSEEALVELARVRRASIFGCEGHAIYHSSRSLYQRWKSTDQTTLVNTGSFVKVWDRIREDGLYALHDWTVKVDADCVFFPARLRTHIRDLAVPAGRQVYVTNTLPRFGLEGFLGAIEILSRRAVEAYLDNAADCEKYIGLHSGEDGYLKDCLDALGVAAVHDPTIMHPDPQAVACQVDDFAAFHPHKAPGDWTYCYDMADGNVARPALAPGIIDLMPAEIQSKLRKRNDELTKEGEPRKKSELTFKRRM